VALRSIRRHVAELEQAHLITRQARIGRPSALVIEDPSAEETHRYLRNFAGPGEDKIVRPYKKEEREEKQNFVNEEQALSEVGEKTRKSPWQSMERGLDGVPRAKREYLAGEMQS
jgi:hypothetical protein